MHTFFYHQICIRLKASSNYDKRIIILALIICVGSFITSLLALVITGNYLFNSTYLRMQ